jgi:hypothetical protein
MAIRREATWVPVRTRFLDIFNIVPRRRLFSITELGALNGGFLAPVAVHPFLR